jgi:hypothetical protein
MVCVWLQDRHHQVGIGHEKVLALSGSAQACISGHLVLGSVFFTLSGVAAVEIAWDHWH